MNSVATCAACLDHACHCLEIREMLEEVVHRDKPDVVGRIEQAHVAQYDITSTRLRRLDLRVVEVDADAVCIEPVLEPQQRGPIAGAEVDEVVGRQIDVGNGADMAH